MFRSRNRIPHVVLTLLLSMAVVGCGGVGSSQTSDMARDAEETAGAVYEEGEAAADTGSTEVAKAAAQLEAPEKMVYTADISLSTREFEQTSDEIDSRLEAAGAIVFGDNMWQNEWSDHVSRTRELTVRVAAEGLKDLVKAMGEIDSAKVTASNVYASDRTKEYNDSESRIQLLQQEYDFYEKTVQETTDPETRLVYTERMFELLDEIKQLENKKSEIDQDVAYSVVTITLSEDTSLASHDGSAGLGQEIEDAFLMIPSNVAAAFGYLLLFVIHALPLLIIVGIIALVVVLIVRRRKARAPKKDATAADLPTRPADADDDQSGEE